WPAVDARLGAFHLSAPLLGELTNEEPLPVTKEEAARLAPAFHDRLTVQEGKFYQRSDQASQPAGAEEEGPPQIGDVRISYKGVRPTTISVIARQQGDSLAPSESGEEGSFQLVEVGAHSKEEMLQQAATRNANTTWFLRGSGAILMLLGLGLIWLGLLWRKKTRRTYEDRRPKVSRA
ncbi:MAG: hypothetical protein JO112_18035, partial [Planctomycetes bacterium]|nr:hypothetical protein [Planctomycetota bacterium]